MKRAAFALATLTLAVSTSAGAQTILIMPGELDLPVVEGSLIPTQCPFVATSGADAPASGCVTFPRDQALNIQNAYMRELISMGWRNAGVSGNTVRMERPIEGGDCSKRLTLAGMPHGSPADIDAWRNGQRQMAQFDTFAFWFALERQPVCGAARTVQPTSQP